MNINWKKIMIIMAATLGITGGGIFLRFVDIANLLPIRIPANLEQIVTIQQSNPEAFEVLLKSLSIHQKTDTDAKTRILGLTWNKFSPNEAVIKELIALGYLTIVNRPNLDSVYYSVWFTTKAISEMEAFVDFVNTNQKVVISSSTP